MAADTAVLDLLFDHCDGVLKEEIPEIQSLDFTSLGLMSGEFSDVLFDDLVLDKQMPRVNTPVDHDYVMQPVQSPSNSDSGVSLESGLQSPQYFNDDHTHSSPDMSSVSGSPTSVSQYSPQMITNQSDYTISTSPAMGKFTLDDPLGLEHFDFGDLTNVDFDTIDSAILNDVENIASTTEQDIKIDLGNHSDLMTFDTTTDMSLHSDGSHTRTVKIIKVGTQLRETLPFTMKDVSTATQKFPELKLTDEERDLLAREGVALPTNMPLTKEEERALKAVRRKIRNKVSAKESRKRKMGYVDGLEKRVKLCTQENQTLQKKIDSLEKQNVSMIGQLKKLQAFVTLKGTRTAQASTYFMVLLLSFAFLVVPNFNPFRNQDSVEDLKSIRLPGKSRNLLHSSVDDFLPTDTDNPYGISIRPGAPWEVPPRTPVLPELKKTTHTQTETSTKEDIPMEDVSDKIVYVQIEKATDSIAKVAQVDLKPNITFVTEAQFQRVNSDSGGVAGTRNPPVLENRRQDL